MKRATVVAAAVLFAHTASAQCVGDANGDGQVTVNEAVQVVNNLLNGCTAQPTACPINFGDNNTMEGTPDCFYTGRWNQSCVHSIGRSRFDPLDWAGFIEPGRNPVNRAAQGVPPVPIPVLSFAGQEQ